MVQFAGLLQALPRSLAYGLKALIDEKQASTGTAADETPPVAASEAPAPEAPADDSATDDTIPADEVPATEAPDDTTPAPEES
jgi:large subunit ribosomal protein L10